MPPPAQRAEHTPSLLRPHPLHIRQSQMGSLAGWERGVQAGTNMGQGQKRGWGVGRDAKGLRSDLEKGWVRAGIPEEEAVFLASILAQHRGSGKFGEIRAGREPHHPSHGLAMCF